MRDDQITNLLRTLEADRDPDPAFAEELYGQLVAMPVRRPRRWPLVLLAAAAVLALAGDAAVGSGLLDVPTTAEATPTPRATLTPTPRPSPSPTASTTTPSPAASSIAPRDSER